MPRRATPPREHDPRITVIQQELFDEKRSKVDKYRDLVVGQPGLGPLLALRAGDAAGAAGCRARSACSCARSCIRWCSARSAATSCSASNVTLRHPHKIHIGDNVVIDDQLLPRRQGHRQQAASSIGNGVFVGRNTILSCKNGDIVIEDRANLGFNCEIFSASRVRVGKTPDGRLHLSGRRRSPLRSHRHPGAGAGPDRARASTSATAPGSARTWWSPTDRRIGRDAIIGAGAVVVGEIPEFAIAAGIPAKVIARPTRRRRGRAARAREPLAASL